MTTAMPSASHLTRRQNTPMTAMATPMTAAHTAPGPASPAAPDAALRPVHLGTVAPAGKSLPTLALAPGSSFALYVNPARVLHAAAYDGALDLPLDDLPGPGRRRLEPTQAVRRQAGLNRRFFSADVC